MNLDDVKTEEEPKANLDASEWLKSYADEVVKIAGDSFNRAAELYAEMAKIYGPRLQAYAKYGQEQFKKHGSQFLEVASKNLQYYGHAAASEGLKLTRKTIDLTIELAKKVVDLANERLSNYRKGSTTSDK